MPFVILSTQRSGTHFLTSLLQSSSGVFSIDETFHNKPLKDNYLKDIGSDVRSFAALDPGPNVDDFYRFLSKRRDTDKPQATQLGCILMYNQAKFLPEPFREALFGQWQVLHLVRHNVLRTEVSNFVNRKRLAPPHIRTKAEVKELFIALPCDDLLKKLHIRAEEIRQHKEMVEPFGGLEVSYEALAEYPAGEIARIAAFLDLGSFAPSTELQRSNPSQLREKLTNFEEVEHCLKNTEFAPLLDG